MKGIHRSFILLLQNLELNMLEFFLNFLESRIKFDRPWCMLHSSGYYALHHPIKMNYVIIVGESMSCIVRIRYQEELYAWATAIMCWASDFLPLLLDHLDDDARHPHLDSLSIASATLISRLAISYGWSRHLYDNWLWRPQKWATTLASSTQRSLKL